MTLVYSRLICIATVFCGFFGIFSSLLEKLRLSCIIDGVPVRDVALLVLVKLLV